MFTYEGFSKSKEHFDLTIRAVPPLSVAVNSRIHESYCKCTSMDIYRIHLYVQLNSFKLFFFHLNSNIVKTNMITFIQYVRYITVLK